MLRTERKPVKGTNYYFFPSPSFGTAKLFKRELDRKPTEASKRAQLCLLLFLTDVLNEKRPAFIKSHRRNYNNVRITRLITLIIPHAN